MTGKPHSPWRMFLPLLLVVALFVLWSLYWLVADRTARQQVARARDRLAAQGLSLACTSETWGGYPFRFEFTCAAPVLSAPGATLKAAHVLAVAQAYNPFHVVSLIDGPTTVVLEGRAPVTASHATAVISVTVSGDRLAQLSGEVTSVDIPGQFEARDLVIHARPSAAGDYDVAIDGAGLTVVPPGRPPLAADTVEFRGTVTAPSHLDISNLVVAAGAITASARGAIDLDDSHRPVGKVTVETNDARGLLDRIAPDLAMTDQQKSAANALVGFLGSTPRLDIVASDGQLFVGPIPAGRLDPLY
jgi:hypothetical protein